MQLNFMLCADNNYLKHVNTLMVSILNNHKEDSVNIFIIHSEDAEHNALSKLKSITSLFPNSQISFISIPDRLTLELSEFYRYPKAVYYRILAIDLLPLDIDNIIYLDIDTIVTHNLSDLIRSAEGAPLAACYDIQADLQCALAEQNNAISMPNDHQYFNSGVLYMDINYMHRYNIGAKLIKSIKDNGNKFLFPDQDAFNYIFSDQVYYLPWQTYNCPAIPLLAQDTESGYELLAYDNINQCESFIDITKIILNKAHIIHYCTPEKPWNHQTNYYQNKNMSYVGELYELYTELTVSLEKCCNQ